MNQLIGQTLDRYQITALLGQGGMGAVYRARDLTLRREVALKLMHGHLAAQAEFKARFVQEARAAANLDHPGIVKVFDIKENGEPLYIVMEYLAGGNLKQMMQRMRESQRWLLLPDIVDLVQQLALALDYAHRQEVLHRDIKPANIMLKPDLAEAERFAPVITDMGLAKLAESSVHTQTGESLGTPAYMSPEQAMGQPVGPATDIFALGVVFYELAVGQLPFTAKTISEAMQIHGKGTPPLPPRARRPDLPQALEAVILKALANQPAQRFKTAKELATALADASSQTVIHTMPAAAKQGALTLATLYQESMVEIASQLPTRRSDETEPPASGSKASIQVTTPDGAVRTIALGSGSLTIGRERDNLLQLDDQRVSRYHARIEADGDTYRVLDLNSRNGTFLGNSRLLPGIPERWQPDQMLKIGDHWLQLFGAQAANQVEASKPTARNTSDNSGPMTLEIELQLAETQVQVEPGSAVELHGKLRNLTTSVGHFQLGLTGVPAEWVSLPAVVRLLPKSEEVIKLRIQPPRSSESRAGYHTLRLYVQRKESDTALATQQVNLLVRAYHQLALAINPQHRRSNPPATFQLKLSNQGNEDIEVELTGEDEQGECLFNFEPTELHLHAGTGETATLQVRLTDYAPRSAESVHSFLVRMYDIKQPEIVTQAKAEWVCLQETKSIEAELQPSQLSASESGEFQLQLQNTGNTAATLRLNAIDSENRCTYTFDPAQVVLNGNAKHVVRLTVKPKRVEQGLVSRKHRFTVTATTVEMPSVTKQLVGEWVEVAVAAKSPLTPELPPQREEKTDEKLKLSPVEKPVIPKPGWGFWLLWTIVTSLLGSCAQIPQGESYTPILGVAIFGAISGLIGGFLQWLLLRKHISGARWWILASVIAWPVGMMSAMSTNSIVSALIQGVVTSAILWLVFRRHMTGAFPWIGANVIALAIGAALISSSSESTIALAVIISGLTYGLMTGIVLVRLLRKAAPQKQALP